MLSSPPLKSNLTTAPGVQGTATILLFEAIDKQGVNRERELADHGHQVIACLPITAALSSAVNRYQPDVVIFDLAQLEPPLLQSIDELYCQQPLPVVVFVRQQTPDIVEQAIRAGISAYVVDMLQPRRLGGILTVAQARFAEYQRLRQELATTKDKLAARKLLERAKGLLMLHQKISEAQAYQQLRKIAMNRGQSLAVAAQSVIDVLGLLDSEN